MDFENGLSKDDLYFEVFKDPLNLNTFQNSFTSNNQPMALTKAVDLIEDFSEKLLTFSPYTSLDPLPDPFIVVRTIDEDEDEDKDISFSKENYNEVNRIFTNIESHHSNLISTFDTYDIPRNIANILMKRIIKLSLQYENRGTINYFDEK